MMKKAISARGSNSAASSEKSMAILTKAARSPAAGKATLAPPQRESSTLSTPLKGPSLMGILAARRFTNRLRETVREKRQLREQNANLQPTYRMEPRNKFQPGKVERAIKDVVDQRLEGCKYNPRLCKTMTRVLSEEVKEKVKGLKFDRYKLVCLVTIGEKKSQQLMVTSRCTWDTNFDNYSTYNFENSNLFCTVTVYGIYAE
ncbi:tctex1 domain-containing protein 1-like [Lingula anatina]|uniref:Tctex1 domain-containing protein 1-like n=1 Tax=Lingula anatina TaxID=7574 RepID=A0A1S3HR02_LINAN|nr:tctex1 domain-containing protein 1-like [Lingula anatina]XP_013388476.1 tctex1 domain-containing protein 1-like [Lingula anatina]|eukprot:XP_013388467.1 tctex1 domain-containing protein 1-like [Lingula anatina]